MIDPSLNTQIKATSNSSVKDYLDLNLCREAGIIPLSIDNKNVKLGAMNPMYGEVNRISQNLKIRYGVNVLIEQISTEEWEKWFDSNENLLNKIDTPKNNLTTEKVNKEQSFSSKLQDKTENDEEFSYIADSLGEEEEESGSEDTKSANVIDDLEQFDFVDFW